MSTQQQLLSLEPGEIAVRIRDGALTIGVVGLGWMGLPTGCLYAEAGARVIGADMNPKVVERVNKGDPPLEEPGLAAMLKKLSAMVRSLSSEERETLEVLLDDELMEVLGSSGDKEDLVSHRFIYPKEKSR